MADYGLRYYNNIISIDLTQIRLRNTIEEKKKVAIIVQVYNIGV